MQIGISRKDIHDARIIRDAEVAEPGVVKAAIDEAIQSVQTDRLLTAGSP